MRAKTVTELAVALAPALIVSGYSVAAGLVALVAGAGAVAYLALRRARIAQRTYELDEAVRAEVLLSGLLAQITRSSESGVKA